MFFSCRNRKVKKPDPPQQQLQQQQQQQQQSTPIISENKENLLTQATKKQHYHHDNESGGFDCSSSGVLPSSITKNISSSPQTSSPIKYDQNLTKLRPTNDQTSKIHVDVSHNPSDKLLHICDSSEPSPRDLTDITLSSMPPHKVNMIFTLKM